MIHACRACSLVLGAWCLVPDALSLGAAGMLRKAISLKRSLQRRSDAWHWHMTYRPKWRSRFMASGINPLSSVVMRVTTCRSIFHSFSQLQRRSDATRAESTLQQPCMDECSDFPIDSSLSSQYTLPQLVTSTATRSQHQLSWWSLTCSALALSIAREERLHTLWKAACLCQHVWKLEVGLWIKIIQKRLLQMSVFSCLCWSLVTITNFQKCWV